MPDLDHGKKTETRPDLTDRTLAAVEAAAERYPSVRLATGELLHVYERRGEWYVWLNTEVSEFDGLCIGIGDARADAVAGALATLQAAIDELRKP